MVESNSTDLLTNLDHRGVLTLTMNRPEVHNAFDGDQIIRLTEVLEAAGDNEEVRVVVITGNGKSFSAGADVNYMRSMGENTREENIADAGRLAKLMKTLNYLPRPTIARVQGPAMGGGVGLVCCCDYAVGSDYARFALSEVKLGMTPATISPYVVRTIGQKAARRLFMSGETVDARLALRLGFLDRLSDSEVLDTTVNDLINTLLRNSPNAVKVSKQLVFDVCQGEIDAAMVEHTVNLIADIRHSEEGREGLSAFLERRSPDWVK